VRKIRLRYIKYILLEAASSLVCYLCDFICLNVLTPTITLQVMTLQLALAGFAEYVLHLTRLNPDILYLHQVCCFVRFYPQSRQSA
jgi:hypothetical protein